MLKSKKDDLREAKRLCDLIPDIQREIEQRETELKNLKKQKNEGETSHLKIIK
jgi:hypothetical protein